MTPITRREFLGQSGSCAAHLALAAVAMPPALRNAWALSPRGTVVAREPWGNLEKVADGVWAMISTPLNGNNTTVSNGGIIAGRNGVLAIEGFNQIQRRHSGPESMGDGSFGAGAGHYHQSEGGTQAREQIRHGRLSGRA